MRITLPHRFKPEAVAFDVEIDANKIKDFFRRPVDRLTLGEAAIEPANLPIVDYEGVDFDYCDFVGASKPYLQFKDCTFLSCRFLADACVRALFAGCKFRDCPQSPTNFDAACFVDTEFQDEHWRGARFRNASFRWCRFRSCSLEAADFAHSEIQRCTFDDCRLTDACMEGAHFSETGMWRVDLSGVRGLTDPARWLAANFDRTEAGYRVYKRLSTPGRHQTGYPVPRRWVVAEGSVLEEVVNTNVFESCGCGVNFGTLRWCRGEYRSAELWECLLRWEDLPTVCVPVNTDGKARCGRLTLVRQV